MSSVIKMTYKAIVGLKHNPKIWIATGLSRFDTKWKNKQILYGELLKKLSEPTRTNETVAEYKSLPKSKRDELKDVGGFVGGTLEGGRRKSDTVKARSLLTFDFDNAPADFISNLYLDLEYAWAAYSTHSHTPDKPRFRLIVPLDREVTPDEYEAIMRRLSEGYGMQYLDASTCQPSRLMYWPSCSHDGEYVFEYNDDALLKADDVLATYPDWNDCSYWPVFPTEVQDRRKKVERQQDPLKKKSLVGTFCRTYSVPDVIEKFLPDVYTATDKPDRYTYSGGSTFGGLVIYDDGAFCYSNHATDPAHGQDLNAFDLVRIHRFGDLDDEAREDTPSTRMPSYLAMLDMIRTDEECIKTLDADRAAAALEDFGDEGTETVPEPEPAESRAWMTKLRRDRKGNIEPSAVNIQRIIKNDPKLQGIRLNAFVKRVQVTEPLPWGKSSGDWSDIDDSRLFIYLVKKYTEFKRSDIRDALTDVAAERSFDPVRDYFDNLPVWDGVSRADTVFIDYLGAEDSKYTRECTHKWLLAGVARTFVPGIKFDYVPVLTGPPGIGKSTLVNKLGVKWFSDSLSFEDMKGKEAAEKIQGIYINEISELKGMKKIEVESIKSFISRQEDRYRPAYGRVADGQPRRCIFVGTSNSADFLKDNTGNRRFWPIPCNKEHKLNAWEMKSDTIDQIWAEIFYFWDDVGERELVLSHSLEDVAENMQTQALEYDERAGLIGEYLEKLLPFGWDSMDREQRRDWLDRDEEGTIPREDVTVIEVWCECFRKAPADKKRSDSDDIARMLKQLGWEYKGKRKRIKGYGQQNVFEKKK